MSVRFVILVLILWVTTFIISYGFFMPQRMVVPVKNATSRDWHPLSFWAEPWGYSGVHKGIDIFARRGTPVVAATDGIVGYTGTLELGGNVVIVVGPKWRLHYYAHMDSVDVRMGQRITRGQSIGRVGNTGNAAGKAPHLHYAMVSLAPDPAGYRDGVQGWKRMFYLDPGEELGRSAKSAN